MEKILYGKKKPDRFGIIVGKTGLGKSNFAQAIGYDFLDESINDSFGTNNIFGTKEEWDLAKRRLKRGDVVIFDEGINVFFSRESLHKDNTEIVREMVRIRKKGFFFLICIPNLRLLDWYIGGDRPHFIIRVNSPNFELWSFITDDNSEQTEEEAHEKMQNILKFGLDSVEADMRGKWNPVEGERWENYLEKADTWEFEEEKNPIIEKDKAKMKEKLYNSLTLSDLTEKYGVSKSTVKRYISKLVPQKHIFWDYGGLYRITLEGDKILEKRWKKYAEKMRKRKYLNRWNSKNRKIKRKRVF